MKLSICFTALAVCSSLAQEPPPNSAPDYHIPLPAEALVPRPVVQTQKIDGVWEQLFFECLVTEDDRARMARFLELVMNTPAECYAAGSRAFVRMDSLGLFSMRAPERDFYWEQFGRLSRETAVKDAAQLAIKEPNRYAGLPRLALQGWAKVAPLEASKWFSARPEPVVGDPLMLRPLVVGWAATDLKAATDFLVSNSKPTDREFQDAVVGMRDFVAAHDFIPGLIAWFGSLPDQDTEPSVKSTALIHVMQRVEAGGMTEVARFLDSIKNEKIVTALVIQRHGSNWARTEPVEAMNWLLSRPPDAKGVRVGVGAVAQVWAGKDAKTFASWMLKNRDHESIDFVILGFVKFLANRDITEARKWAKEIKAPTVRAEAEESL